MANIRFDNGAKTTPDPTANPAQKIPGIAGTTDIHFEMGDLVAALSSGDRSTVVFVDDGASGYTGGDANSRIYLGPTDPSTVVGYTARSGDIWIETTA